MIRFTKMHGLGNDFIIVNKSSILGYHNIKNIVLEYADRKTGIGCDQFIIYEEAGNEVIMEIYNSDGSRALACGNASRCLAHLLTQNSPSKKIKLKVGERVVEAEAKSLDEVLVNMGGAIFEDGWMPTRDQLSAELTQYLSHNAEFMCISVGNPHIVIMDQNLSNEDAAILGPRLEKSALFKDGVNVNFARIENGKIALRVWERGAGFTLACGSGACATFAALHKLGFAQDEATISFELGDLKMKMKEGKVLMSGPVSYVAKGELI
ncbi:MAG: diaminopimelate epimerase [Rickettsiaceae bacterium]|nr:diaminopimelate epimerase [Rickettsiaceae bacterium]